MVYRARAHLLKTLATDEIHTHTPVACSLLEYLTDSCVPGFLSCPIPSSPPWLMWNAYQEAQKGVEHTKPKFWVLGVHSLDDMRWPKGYLVRVEGAPSR